MKELAEEWYSEIREWEYYVNQIQEILTQECHHALEQFKIYLSNSKCYGWQQAEQSLHNLVQVYLLSLTWFYILNFLNIFYSIDFLSQELNRVIINNERVYRETGVRLRLVGDTMISEWKRKYKLREREKLRYLKILTSFYKNNFDHFRFGYRGPCLRGRSGPRLPYLLIN
jgi:hypothetical protein